MKVLHWLDRHLEEAISVLLLAVITVVVTIQVILRETGSALAWTEELTRYMFVWLIYISSSYAIRLRGHIKVEVISLLLKERGKLVLDLISNVAFFVFAGVAGVLFFLFFRKLQNHYHKDMRRFVILAFVFCLLISYCAEEFFGVADITGAFIAGLIISNTQRAPYIASRFETLSYTLISPVFFASIGLKMVMPEMTTSIIVFSILLMVIAVLTKIVGCGLGAKLCHFTTRESVQVGVGMVSRGEVALIVATKGAALGLMSDSFMGPIILTVVLTTVIAPVLLKIAFSDKGGKGDADQKVEESELVKNYNIAMKGEDDEVPAGARS